MQITSKRESTDGYKNGRFGNHLRQWDDPDAALAECGWYGSNGFMIRWRGAGSQGVAQTCNGMFDLKNWWAHHVFNAAKNPRDFYVSERCPDDKLTFQGEICEAPHVGGYSLHWSTMKDVQRRALSLRGEHHQGPGAKLLCKQFMDGDSYEDLLTLLDLYPLHTVEFSCFSVRLGNLRRNTVFWEVRNC